MDRYNKDGTRRLDFSDRLEGLGVVFRFVAVPVFCVVVFIAALRLLGIL